MTLVTFQYADRDDVQIQALTDETLMRAAVNNAVPGIVGECGGMGICGTCHVLVSAECADKLPAITEQEEDVLVFTVENRNEALSRIACQITLDESLQELTFTVPVETR